MISIFLVQKNRRVFKIVRKRFEVCHSRMEMNEAASEMVLFVSVVVKKDE